MRYIRCPSCLGKGVLRYVRRLEKCPYCHGKKKISQDYEKWLNLRNKYGKRVFKSLQNSLNQKLKEKMKLWDEKHIKPRKFKKEK